METIADRLQSIRQRIAETCCRAGRDPQSITLVSVTKEADIEDVAAVLRAGCRDLGENRVAELERKQLMLGEHVPPEILAAVRWHLIGHLQTNKVAKVVPLAQMIQSVDSVRLAEKINAAAAQRGAVDILLQVNISQEQTKFGVSAADFFPLLGAVSALPHLRVRGLMGIGPLTEHAESTRGCFQSLAELFNAAKRRLEGDQAAMFTVLSMGMTHDFEMAIEAGATMLRIGSALFKDRERK